MSQPIPLLAIETFITGLTTTGKYMIGSGCSFIVANAIPDEESFIKAASAVTGWALALVCIYTLAKAVRFLYGKIEEKDSVIISLHTAAETKTDLQREEILEELRSLNATAVQTKNEARQK